jgi:hypothetical protein
MRRRKIRKKRKMKSMSVMKDIILIKEAKNEKHCVTGKYQMPSK